MTSEALTGLINNTALLLALAVLYDTFSLKPKRYTSLIKLLTGLFISVIGIAVMLSPWTLMPGVIFDTRSILLSITGLFFGAIPALIAVVITSLFRLLQGGAGAWTGVAVIVASAGIGLGWRRYAQDRQLGVAELYLFGLTVHAVMIALMLTLPSSVSRQVINTIGVPVLVIFPVGTVLLGKMLTRQLNRKETEEALRESEARLRRIVQGMPVMLDAFDENDLIIAWNAECERVLGYSADEIISNPKAWAMLYPDANYLAQMRRVCAEQGSDSYSWEWKVHCKDGSEKTIAWLNVSNLIKIPGWASWGVGIDVTDRVRAMTALRDAEERLRLALSAANVGLWDWDLRTNAIYFSPEWKRQLGYEEHELTNQFSEWEERLHPDDARDAVAAVDAYLKDPGAKFEQEFRLRHRDGSYRSILAQASLLFDEDASPIRMLGSHVDITARKQAEEALRASEAHLGAVLSSTPIVLLALDRDGMITLMQGQGLNILAIDPNQWIGRSIFDSADVPAGAIPVRESLRADFTRALAGEVVDSTELIGGYNFAIHYTPLRSKSGAITGAIAVGTDVTQRLEAEKLRIELEKEQEIIALRERFITIASHDFRTPLTVIKMAANMLETYFDRMPIERRTVKLQQISTQVERMTNLLNNALVVSRANAGKIDFEPEVVQLEAFARGLWTDVTAQAQETHRLEFSYELDIEQVMLDAKLMYRVLANLIGNAIKYSPVQGFVRFVVTRENDLLVFRISDNGIGIPEGDMKRLFEPFFRGTNTGGIDGTGLGLSIVNSFVEAHGGRIAVESKEGRGTTFVISLPFEAV